MTTESHPCGDFDHLDPSLPSRLYETYTELRDQCPVARGEKFGGFWAFSRHEDCVTILKNHRVFTSSQGVTIPHLGNFVPAIPTESDEPRHTDYRDALMPFLTPAAVRDFEPFVRDLVNRLIDEVIEDGQCDAIGTFARQVPGVVVGRLFGYTEEDALRCVDWMAEMFAAGGRGDLEAQVAAAKAVISYIQEQVNDRRSSPRGPDDVITALVQANPAGGAFSNDEIVGLLFTGTIGAVETTVNTIGHMLRYVGTCPDVRAQLLADPGLAPRAVEEALRIEAPAQQAARTVSASFTIGGQELQPGDRLIMLWGSANRDERVFSDPDSFRLDRPSYPHLSFSHGIHKCAGMHLARLELRVVLEEILARIPDYQIVDVVGPTLTGGISWHIDSMPITFTPRSRPTKSDAALTAERN